MSKYDSSLGYKSLGRILRHLRTYYLLNPGMRWTLPQPVAKGINGMKFTTGQHFHVTIHEVFGIARQVVLNCLLLGARPEENTLDPASYTTKFANSHGKLIIAG